MSTNKNQKTTKSTKTTKPVAKATAKPATKPADKKAMPIAKAIFKPATTQAKKPAKAMSVLDKANKIAKGAAKKVAKQPALDWSKAKTAQFADYGGGTIHFQIPMPDGYKRFSIGDASDAMMVAVANAPRNKKSCAGTNRPYAECKLIKSPTNADEMVMQWKDGEPPVYLHDMFQGFSKLTPKDLLD